MARRRQPALGRTAGREAALRALLRPYEGRPFPPPSDAIYARARSALRQAGETATFSSARQLSEEARDRHELVTGVREPDPMTSPALILCRIDEPVPSPRRRPADDPQGSPRTQARLAPARLRRHR